MNIFSEKPTNLDRQVELDLLRGFTAILIVIVHVGLYLGNVIDIELWTFCDIVGSEPCAPVLMVLMGISTSYSSHQRPHDLLKRGINLFIFGYILSFFRSILPLLIIGEANEWASISAFFVVDILQFAGLSFMLIALFKKLKLSDVDILIISLIMVVINQYLMLGDYTLGANEILIGIVNLFYPITAWSCFPLFTWFIFVAFGVVYGNMLIRCTNKNKLYGVQFPISLFVTIYVYYQLYDLYPYYSSYYWGNNYYYMGLKNVVLTIFIVCFLMSFWFFVGKILPNFIKKWLEFLSKNLNIYYINSWIIISMLIHFQSVYNWKFTNFLTIGIMILLVIGCALITKFELSFKEKIKGIKFKE